tara:strand:- start:215 stop:481 length:267 start_codon:yes stop_codon:yes gene_type:complete
MALTKEIIIGQIEIVGPFKVIQVREDIVVKEDGVELSRKFHRHTVQCDVSAEDLALEHADVQGIANSGIWTQELKDEWEVKKAEAQQV